MAFIFTNENGTAYSILIDDAIQDVEFNFFIFNRQNVIGAVPVALPTSALSPHLAYLYADADADADAGWLITLNNAIISNQTALYFRNTQANAIGANYYDWLITAGSVADTAVVNTTVAGSAIPFTRTAGGANIKWITPRFDVGGATITSHDISLWGLESALTVNAGLSYRLFKRAAGGTETALGSAIPSGVELTTANANYFWFGGSVSYTLLEDERLGIEVLADNVGVMTAGTATFNFNGAAGGNPTYALVQTASGFGDALTVPVNKATVTLLSAPIVGNVMFAQYFSRAVTQTPPAGWTLAINQNNATEQDNQCIYYRIVQSGDGTTYVFGDGTDIEIVTITEWSSSTGWPSNPVDVTASVGRTTAVSTLSSGTTASTSQAATVSIAAIGLRNVQANTPIWTNGFTAQSVAFNTSGPSSLIPAYKIESVAGAKESTVSWSGGAETAMGVIAVFKGNSGSGADSYLNIYPAVAFKAEAAGSYTLTALTGAYVLSGQNATLTKSKLITANAGAYTYAGISAILKRNRVLTAQTGAYVVAGQSATLTKSKVLTANTGAYVLTGNSAVLTYTAGATAYKLTALTGNYTIAGNPATLSKSKLINANTGAYTYAGIAATLTRSKRLVALTGNYTVNGQSAVLTRSKRIVATTGNYSLVGNNAILTYTPLAGAYTLTCLTGAYVLAGNSANLLTSNNQPLLTDTHDGYWRKRWLKSKKKPFEPQTIDEVIEFVNEQAQEILEQPKKSVKDKQIYDVQALFDIQARIQIAERLMAIYQQEIEDEEDEIMALMGMM